MRSSMKTWSWTWIAPLVLLACGSDGPGAAPGGGAAGNGAGGASGASGSGPTCAESPNDAVRLALAPSCEGCHSATSGKPFFASLASFEATLAYNEAYVVRGKPDESRLVALLEGTATGTYQRMPLGNQSFADLAQKGQTKISVEQIRAWITALPAQGSESRAPDPTAVSTRRLRADELLKAVQIALGYPTATGGVPPLLGGSMQPLSPDSPKTIDYNDDGRRESYKMLGGPSYMDGRPPEKSWSPSSLAVVTQIATRECTRAVKDKSPVFFKFATPADTLPAGAAAVNANVAYLHRRFLGLTATPDDTKALVDQVFVPASARGAEVAWVEVCAALIRHPHFVTF
jgi:hypothetical protein